MTHLAAIIGAVGAVLLLIAGRRVTFLGGVLAFAAAELLLARAGGLHLSAKPVGAAIVGASRPSQVEENAAASGIVLDDATLQAIDDAVADVAVR